MTGYTGPTGPTSLLLQPIEGPRTFCVLGVPRGGTSLIAGLLRRFGIFIGDELDPDVDEDMAFLGHKGHRDLFTAAERLADRDAYLAQVAELIGRRNREHEVWGWKDPISHLYIADIVPLLRNVHYIFVTRDLGAAGQREMLIEGGDWPPNHVLSHIYGAAAALMEICGYLSGQRAPQLLVSYERGLRDPQALVDELAAFVGVTAPDGIASFVRNQ